MFSNIIICSPVIAYLENINNLEILPYLLHFSEDLKRILTRAAVDGTPSQIPAFLPITFTLGSRSHKIVAQYLLHNVTYAPVKFEVDMSNG